MTPIPDYLTVLAMARHSHEPHEIHAVRDAGVSLRQRIATRLARRSDAPARTAAPTLMLPELRDYPYRSGC